MKIWNVNDNYLALSLKLLLMKLRGQSNGQGQYINRIIPKFILKFDRFNIHFGLKYKRFTRMKFIQNTFYTQ